MITNEAYPGYITVYFYRLFLSTFKENEGNSGANDFTF